MSIPAEPDSDVAVIGAGISGLTTALLLSEAGLKVTVLEASSVPGGRVRSLLDPQSGKYLADLGPTWVWPEYQPIVARWLARLGLQSFAQYETGDAVVQMTEDQPLMRRPVPGQHGIRRISGGTGALVDRLVSTLPEGCIRTSVPVRRISQREHGLEIEFAGDEPGRILTRFAVLATPLRIAADNIDLASALDRNALEQMKAAPTWMAAQAKAVVVFDNPFWREQGLSGRLASQVGPLVEAHDHSRDDQASHCVFGFIGWPAHIRRQNAQRLEGQIRRQLVQCFGSSALEIRQFHIEDWAENPLVCSPLDLRGTQNHPAVVPDSFRRLHGHGRLAFAVAETSRRSPGLIEGALEAAEQAAKNILQPIQGQPTSDVGIH